MFENGQKNRIWRKNEKEDGESHPLSWNQTVL